ncbi:MAG TPA: hypothetical protein PKO36_16460, partial [Candidatus Hydrogenedentes bacterium]|nr:hypothetical protein [Candidatus Hydrogenedentota bacterium]
KGKSTFNLKQTVERSSCDQTMDELDIADPVDFIRALKRLAEPYRPQSPPRPRNKPEAFGFYYQIQDKSFGDPAMICYSRNRPMT